MATGQSMVSLIGLLVRLTILVGCGLLSAGCSGAQSSQEAEPTRVPLPAVPAKPTYEVQRGEVVKALEFRGRIVPVVEEELFFRTSGYVAEVYVDRDDMVKAGDLLAELETTDLQNQLAQATVDLEALQLDADQRTAEAEAGLRIAELRLAKMTANDPSPQVIIAEVDVERAQLALSDVQETYDEAWDPARDWELNASRWSREALEAEREATERALRQAELSLKAAEARYQQAVQSFTYDVQIMEQEVTLARLQLQEIEAGLDIQRAQITVRRLEDQLADARVVAPFDGQVMFISIVEGRAVDAYNRAILLAEPDELEVRADMQAADARQLAQGMPAVVEITNRPGEKVSGHVRRVPYGGGGGGEADGSVRVALEEGQFELGDVVLVTVVLERKDDVLWLPPEAIRSFEGRDFVVVQEGEVQRRVDVKLGIEAEDQVEIEEGLSQGQIVVGQ